MHIQQSAGMSIQCRPLACLGQFPYIESVRDFVIVMDIVQVYNACSRVAVKVLLISSSHGLHIVSDLCICLQKTVEVSTGRKIKLQPTHHILVIRHLTLHVFRDL
jgi:hypothetical protein